MERLKNKVSKLVSTMSLKEILIDHIRVGKKTVFAKLYQQGEMSRVEAIYSSTAECKG